MKEDLDLILSNIDKDIELNTQKLKALTEDDYRDVSLLVADIDIDLNQPLGED